MVQYDEGNSSSNIKRRIEPPGAVFYFDKKGTRCLYSENSIERSHHSADTVRIGAVSVTSPSMTRAGLSHRIKNMNVRNIGVRRDKKGRSL